MNACETAQLATIQRVFPNAVLLTVTETAEILRMSPQAVAQSLHRRQFGFDIVKRGKLVFFPVPLLAAWLCGASSKSQPVAVKMPARTSSRVRTQKDFQERLAALSQMIAEKAQALRASASDKDDAKALKALNEAREHHALASAELLALVERQALRARVGL